MARLPLVDPSQAEGKTQTLFDTVRARSGNKVPNMMRTMANSPAVLEAYLGFSGALEGGVLDKKLRQRIALLTSQTNNCHYCLAAHNMLGKFAGLDDNERMENRHGHSDDPKAEIALNFARLLIENHGTVGDDEVELVKDAGYSDAEIAEIIAHVALTIFTNYFNVATDAAVDFPPAPALTQ